MAGRQRTYGFHEITSVIRSQRPESLTIDKLVPVADADATHAGARMLYSGRLAMRVSSRQRQAQPDFPKDNALPPRTSPPALALHRHRGEA